MCAVPPVGQDLLIEKILLKIQTSSLLQWYEMQLPTTPKDQKDETLQIPDQNPVLLFNSHQQ